METAIGIFRVLFWAVGFFALIGMCLCAVYYLGFIHGVEDERRRTRERQGADAFDRAIRRVRELAEKDPDMWDTEIDA